MIQMNLSTKQTQTQRTDLWLPRGKEVGEGRIGSLGLADANHYTLNESTRSYCIAQGTMFNIL